MHFNFKLEGSYIQKLNPVKYTSKLTSIIVLKPVFEKVQN